MAHDAVGALLAWCAAQGVLLDDRIDVTKVRDKHEDESAWQAESGALAVCARQPIAFNDTIVVIPTSAVLSCKSSDLRHNAFFQEALQDASNDSLHLALCVLYEQLLGDASRFRDYLASFPDHIHSSLTWDKNSTECTWIQGTESARMLQRAAYYQATANPQGWCLARVAAYWDGVGSSILHAVFPGMMQCTWPKFLHAFMLVSSRAFIINVFHGLCMVPIADLFNHTDMHNVQVEAEELVCLKCGASRHKTCRVASAPVTVDIRCIEPVEKSEELINSYGDLSNAALLIKYGFVLDSKTVFEQYGYDIGYPEERAEIEHILAQCTIHFVPTDECVPSSWDSLRCLEPETMASTQRLAQEDSVYPPFCDGDLVLDFVPQAHGGRATWVLWRLCLAAALLEHEVAGIKQLHIWKRI
ncbi:hypothetical protein MVES_000549 [Malassezia vespertilionis]|uniref:Uncharacterized protein n=1 Tax=Malassezia vespertilionis TaxID=2020962 RepID=A0A2N1JFQ1_9BASI|nr:hypothetical protein MVES_000549 [Malassezia vespertilionis]